MGYGHLPARDAGLASALTTLDIADHSPAQLAWSPDGRHLSLLDPSDGVLVIDGPPLLQV